MALFWTVTVFVWRALAARSEVVVGSPLAIEGAIHVVTETVGDMTVSHIADQAVVAVDMANHQVAEQGTGWQFQGCLQRAVGRI